MASVEHEIVVDLVREAPQVLSELLRTAFGIELGSELVLEPAAESLTEIVPAEYRADTVMVDRRSGSTIVEAFIVEVQRDPNPRKRNTWPQYVVGLRARLECPVALVVIAPDEATARWSAKPIDAGRGLLVHLPLVIGPEQLPRVLAPDATPEVAVLAAIAHGRTLAQSEAVALGSAALTAVARLDPDRRTLYTDVILEALGPAARAILEAQMIEGYEFKSDFFRKAIAKESAQARAAGMAEGMAEGTAEGARRLLLAVLEARGLVFGAEDLARISASADVEQLEAWARRAVTALRVDEIFR